MSGLRITALVALALAAPLPGCGGDSPRRVAPTHWPPAVEANFMRACVARAGPDVAPGVAARACGCGVSVLRRRLSLRRFVAVDRARGELPAALRREVVARCRP